MCLEDVGRIAFPEHLASFLNHILREVPAVTVPVHTHLWTTLALVSICAIRATLTAWIRRITRPHNGHAVSSRRLLSSCLLMCQPREKLWAIYVFYAQLQVCHEMLRHSKISG